MKKKGDYKVGYGKPPTHSRFKKGESGNPSGKRRREPTLAEYLAKELSKTITLTENGQVRRVTKREAIAKRFVQMALQGDHRAQKRILDMNSAEQPVALEDMVIDVTMVFDEEQRRTAKDEDQNS